MSQLRVLSMTAAAIGVAITSLIWRAQDAEPLDGLVDTLRELERRPIEARIGGFPYGPPSRERGESESTPLRLRAAAAHILQTTPSDSRAATRARAAALLVAGDATESVQLFEQVAMCNGSDPVAWSDVAAARYEAAKAVADASLYADAVAAADRALELNPGLHEACFNRGLALAAMHFAAFAADELSRCASGEDEWAREAGERAGALRRRRQRTADWPDAEKQLRHAARNGDRPAVKQLILLYPQQARTWGEGVYLAEWGEAVLQNKTAEAAESIRVTSMIGDVLAASSGERLLSDAIAAASRDGADLERLAAAHVEYKRGRIALGSRLPSEAVDYLARAEREFQSLGSPMALMARYFRANALYDLGDTQQALALLRDVASPSRNGYVALRAQIAWTRSTIAGRVGRPHEALQYSRSAAAHFDELRERENGLTMRLSEAATLGALGHMAEAWTAYMRVFEVVGASTDARLTERALNAFARTLLIEQRWSAAEAMLRIQRQLPDTSPRYRFDAQLWMTLARVRAGGGTPDDAIPALRGAAAAIKDDALRAEALDDARFIEASLTTDTAESIRLLSETIAYRTATQRELVLPEAYVERAALYRRTGALDAAMSDLSRAVAIVERQTAAIGGDALRDAFFGSRRRLFTELAALHLLRDETALAFDAAERGRAMRAMERFASDGNDGSLDHLPTEELVRRLPPNTMVVEYLVLDDRLIVFTATASGIRSHFVPVSASALATKVAAFTRGLRSSDVASAEREALSRILLDPIAAELARASALVIVPDGPLADVPFAALQAGGRDESPLVARLPIASAPSASAYVRMAAERPRGARRVLLIGDPATASTKWPRLPGAHDEVTRIAALHGDALTLTGTDATRERFLSAVRDSTIIHVASHALPSDRTPELSALILAPGASGDGMVYVRDLREQRLTGAPIVVLAGCQTGVMSKRGGAARSMAIALLASGSRAVVATLWDVDDLATSFASVRFHRALLAGEAPAAALRRVQLDMASSADPRLNNPQAWAGLQVFGAGF